LRTRTGACEDASGGRPARAAAAAAAAVLARHLVRAEQEGETRGASARSLARLLGQAGRRPTEARPIHAQPRRVLRGPARELTRTLAGAVQAHARTAQDHLQVSRWLFSSQFQDSISSLVACRFNWRKLLL